MTLEEIVDALAKSKGIKSEAAFLLGIARSTFNDRIKSLSVQQINEQIIKEEILKLADYKPQKPTFLGFPHRGGTKESVPTFFLSDFHWGEVVLPENVNDLNEYNVEIAKSRLHKCTQGFLDVCFDHIKCEYPGVVVCLGGDMISGDIHDELRETNEGHTVNHVLSLFDNLVHSLETIKKEFKKMYVPCVYGNHGRLTKEYRFKTAASTNMDWLLYNLLTKYFKKDENITFQIPTGFDLNYKVYDTSYLLTHGDRIGASGSGGILGQLTPIARGIKKVRSTYQTMHMPIDYVLMGHWHVYRELEDGIVNGSLKGFDEYVMGMRFDPEVPKQAMWLTHPEYGITLRTAIYSEVKNLKKESPWVSWHD